MTETHRLPTSSREEHLQQARSAAEAVTTYSVEGSPEALLADAVQHLVAAVTEKRPSPASVRIDDPSVGDWFARKVLAALVHKNGGSLEVALDDFLNEENSDLDAHYDEGRRLYRIEPRSVPDQT